MDIERLTKTQIVLLTLLVSFVTSIATGIVTVTLLDQAPPAITQTINRVVERTVERVVPDKSQSAAVVTTEKTVVVKEEDLITDSINKNTKHLVRIFEVTGTGEQATRTFLGLGVAVARDGLVATDAAVVGATGSYQVEGSGGSVYQAALVQEGEGSPVALLKLTRQDDEGNTQTATLSPVAFAEADALKLGQTVLTLSGRERTNVAMGIISGLAMREQGAPAEGEEALAPTLQFVETTLGGTNVLAGSPLLNIFGEVVGLHTANARNRGAGIYTPVNAIRGELSTLIERLQGESATQEGESAASDGAGNTSS